MKNFRNDDGLVNLTGEIFFYNSNFKMTRQFFSFPLAYKCFQSVVYMLNYHSLM